MRIERLDLLAFGPFTDVVLELSGPGLQVIYGLNEAGKSSARAAVTNLLFGIEVRTAYDFVHPKPAMKLGARLLDDDGEVLEVVRYKRAKDDLIDTASGAALEPGRWAGLLGGVSEGDYRSLFTLGHDELVTRTADLVRHGGQVGEVLFAAALGRARVGGTGGVGGVGGVGGTGGVGGVLDTLDREAEGLYRRRGRRQRVNELLASAAQARDEVRQSMVLPSNFDRVRRECRRAAEAHRDLTATRSRLRVEHDRLTTLRAVLPVLAERARLAAERQVLVPEGRTYPAGWGERVKAALDQQAALAGNRAAATARVEIEDEKLALIVIDQGLIERAAQVRAVAEGISRFETDLRDRGGLEEGRREAETRLQVVLGSLANDRPGAAVLDDVRAVLAGREALAAARDRWSKATVDTAHAARDVAGAEAELSHVVAQLEELGDAVDPEPLRAALSAARRPGDLDGQVAQAATAVERARQRLTEVASRLDLLSETVGAVVAQPGPGEDEALRVLAEVGEAEASAARSATRAAQCHDQRAQLGAELRRLTEGGEPPSPADVTSRRAARDQVWATIRATWLDHGVVTGPASERGWADDAALAAEFEARQAAADQTADRLWREAERAETRRQLEAAIERASNQADEARADTARFTLIAEDVYARWRARWPESATSASPHGLRTHLGLLDSLREHERERADRSLELDQVSITRRAHRQALVRLLATPESVGSAKSAGSAGSTRSAGSAGSTRSAGSAGSAASAVAEDERIGTVSAQAEAELERLDSLQGSRSEALTRDRRLRRDLPVLQVTLDQSRQAETEAETALMTLLGPFAGQARTPEAALTVTARLDELARHLGDMEDRADRIAGIDRRNDEFLATLAALLAIAPDVPPDPAADAARTLLTRLADSERSAESRRTHREGRDRSLAEQDEASASLAGLDEELRRLAGEASISDPADLASAADRARSIERLEERLAAVDAQLAQQAPGLPAARLEAEAAGRDVPTLETELTESLATLELVDTEIETAADRQREVRQELNAMDGSERAAEAAAEADRATSAAIEVGEQCARLLLARVLADEAIRRFRQANQDPVLAAAGHYLDTVTGGRYCTVGADDRTGSLQLTGRNGGGVAKELGQLSTGVGDQLWFALRLAAIEAAVTRGGAIPVVVDDVLVNFDDQRTQAALGALGELAQVTQVLLFTHHRGVAELVRDTLAPELASVRTLGGA